MDSLVLTRLTFTFLPLLLLLLLANWISQGHSAFPYDNYIQEKCGMSRLPNITVKISYTYTTDYNVDEAEMHHWATVNIQDFRFPYYELAGPAIRQSDYCKFESMIIGGNGYFVLRAEAEAEGRPSKTIWIIDPLDKRRLYFTADLVHLLLNPKTLDFTLSYRNNQTEVGFNPFSSTPKVIFHGFVFVICGESFNVCSDKPVGPSIQVSKTEL